ncbi:MAG: hypothetical protein HQ478_03865 [Chloroflexi bacterium]|nr:hypothetical protein [Chloroflexota bacterium]
MLDVQRIEFANAFLDPLQNTWHSQFRRDLVKSSGDERLDPSGQMVGAYLKVTGTVQGYVLYYLASETAARLAEEFGSRPLKLGGDVALGAVNDLMQVVSSNALILMKEASQAIEIVPGEVFACTESGFSGDEEWTYSGRFKTSGDASSIFGADDIYGFVYLITMTDSDAPPVPDVPGIIAAAKATLGPKPGAGLSSNISAPPPMPVHGVDKPREIAELRAETLKARNVFVMDNRGRKRIAVSAKDDGSTSIIFADADGRMRATIALSNKGIGRIMFMDHLGKRVFAAPASMKAAKDVRDRSQRSAQRRLEGAKTALDETDSEATDIFKTLITRPPEAA